MCPIAVGAGHGVEAEPLGDLVGPADFLEDLHAPAAADDCQLRHGGDFRAHGGFLRQRHGEDEVRVVHHMWQRRTAGFEAADDSGEIAAARPADGQFDRARGGGAVHGETGGIGPTVTQRAQHAGEQRPEFRLEHVVLQEKSDDAAHCQTPPDQ